METSPKNQAKQDFFGDPRVLKLSDENWVISLKIMVIQTSPKLPMA